MIKVIYCLVAAVIFVLPAQGLGEEGYSLVGEREQELTSPETIRELARIHYARARNHYRRREYEKAKAEFRKVLNFQPQHQGAQWYLQHLRKELARYGEKQGLKPALESIDQPKPLESYQPEPQKITQSEEEKRKLKKINAFYKKGKDYLCRGLYSEAIACFEKVIELGESP